MHDANKNQESKKTHFHNTIIAGHCVPIDQDVINIFSIWKILEKFKPVERYWIFTRGHVKSNGVERTK